MFKVFIIYAIGNITAGYFTSRPSLKKNLRQVSNYLGKLCYVNYLPCVYLLFYYTCVCVFFLASARQLALMFPSTPCTTTTGTEKVCTDNLEAALGLITHHDGVSGTEKQVPFLLSFFY